MWERICYPLLFFMGPGHPLLLTVTPMLDYTLCLITFGPVYSKLPAHGCFQGTKHTNSSNHENCVFLQGSTRFLAACITQELKARRETVRFYRNQHMVFVGNKAHKFQQVKKHVF
jgi:hypothetical protein